MSLGHPVNGVYPLLVTVSQGEKAQRFGYYLQPLPADFGLAFRLTKLAHQVEEGMPSFYDVRLDPRGREFELSKSELPEQLLFTPDSRRLIGLVRPRYGALETEWPDVVRVWQASDGKTIAGGKVPSTVRDLAVIPDSNWVVAACEHGQIRFLSTATWAQVLALKGHTKAVRSVAFSADGHPAALRRRRRHGSRLAGHEVAHRDDAKQIPALLAEPTQ
jgi:hypothetical protein